MNEQHGNRIATTILNRLSELGYEVRESGSYAKLEAEAQALRKEVAVLRARVVVVPERLSKFNERSSLDQGWNACLDELARLNGKVVSEGLLRDLLKSAQKLSDRAAGFAVSGVEFIEIGDNNSAIVELEVTLDELRALLGEGKEVGHETDQGAAR